jgi:hypothetical protein
MIMFLAFGLPFAANGMLFDNLKTIFQLWTERRIKKDVYPNAFEEFPHDVALWFLDRVQRFSRKENYLKL